MPSSQLVTKIKALGPWHQDLDFGNGITTGGSWKPAKQFKMLEQDLPQSLDGKTVIDVGSNAGGISFEFAKRGAKVTGIEYSKKYFMQAELYKHHCKIENVTFVNDTIFNLHMYQPCDILLVLGIVYHVRHFQFLLDYLSHIKARKMFISTQIKTDDDYSMRSRQYIKSHTARGWEPTIPMFIELLKYSGFSDIKLLQLPDDIQGFTNACYVSCTPETPVDVDISLLSAVGKYQSCIWS